MLVQRLIVIVMLALSAPLVLAECPDWLVEEFNRLRSTETVNLCEAFAGKPLLIVNTASFCGYTGQFTGLEALHRSYGPRGLVVIGVPSNDFRQEAASQDKTAEVCFVDYEVTFTMTAPQRVRGTDAHPLFRELARRSGSEPQWNFNKYLVDQGTGEVRHFSSQVRPGDDSLKGAIESLL
ncbi:MULTISPECIES: glutathione peroxidase [Marinobacter]|uniref:Glutathione peroxidase n=1 Tax=Marinobacter profundi TaxID=2666256 RepID=A0A2G1ULH7_9GAMM|nr:MULTISPECIES: glutathione peroxidase [Marinobacter]MBD3658399.1 glutathione peroxidase [Marinobacter sp.]PHQ15313.1 glutathione peroxidase [Marinobacter profundi]